ncbi:MAG: hypothetical protein DLM50_01445 [Candidatus Meridianibacter frigidus]|nr:MAG: hypothetical protein DLM50_01445 [Candidatus Eremiobacteraeota bacterium]
MIAAVKTRASDGLEVGALQSGARGKTLIYVHGVGSSAAIWNDQLEAFAGRTRGLAVQLRGNGALPDPNPALVTRAGFMRDVLAVADAAGAQRFHLVGCSLGGVVGFELWKHVPERLASMVLVGSFAAYPNAQQTVENITAAVRSADSMHAFAVDRTPRILPPDAPAERVQATIEQMAAKSRECYIAATRATWTGDYRSLLGGITIPVLVICGDLDPIAPVALSQEIAAGVPGARLQIIHGASHITNADAPDYFNALLEEFLKYAEV